MPRWLKISALTFAGILTLLGAGAYAYYKYIGIIPSHDYETEPPALPQFSKPAVLIFNKTNGFRHIDALPVADALFTELAQAHGWDVFVTDNAAVHNPGVLDNFDLVIWNNVSGDVLTNEQRSSLKQWLTNGGGWLGVHGSGGDTSYQWPWYVQTLIGAQFIGHTMMPQFQDAELYRTDLDSVVTEHLSTPWQIPAEEWYAFDASPRDKGYEILVTIDPDSYETHGPVDSGWMEGWSDRMGSDGEHPQVWRHRLGQGRAFYSAIGHQPATYGIPAYRELLSKAMRWAMGESSE
ncbi:ThuA domain-containing protein [Parahaliea mediterranea]|uniref:ThuA domain-containing protein n=1 Tax=Parahaliea mediterranea TaxID=651086 RepID=UPI000E2F7CC2|nr:ThuA domain-containing protein [Parahaliea mediterranea]